MRSMMELTSNSDLFKRYIQFLESSFFLMLISTLSKPIYDWLSNFSTLNFVVLHQIISVVFLMNISIFSLIYGKIKFSSLSLIFLLAFIVSLFYGLLGELITNISYVPSQFFYYLNPILSISGGFILWSIRRDRISWYLDFLGRLFFPLLIFLGIIYYAIHTTTNLWEYFGYSSGIITAYVMIARPNKFNALLGFITDLFSGKRTVIGLWIAIMGLARPVLVFIFLLIFFAFGLYYLIDFIPQRYLYVLTVDIADSESLFLATGGRSAEYFGVINKFNDSDLINLFTGFGFGANYQTADITNTIFETRHYSHLSFFTYSLISGFLFSTIVYVLLFYYLAKYFRLRHSVIYKLFFIYILLSFFGAVLMVETLPWIILGFLIAEEQFIQLGNKND